MKHTWGHRLLKWFLWTLAGIVILAIAVPCLVYVPWVQDIVVPIVCDKVSRSTGMDIQVGKLRLRWPLRLTVERVCIIEATGDTMLRAGVLEADVRMAPLFHLDIVADQVGLRQAMYSMGGPDSIMQLRAHIDDARLTDADVNLREGTIDLRSGLVDGARVRLVMLDSVDQKPVPPPNPEAVKWRIHAGEIVLKNVDYAMQMLPTIDQLTAHVGVARLDDGVVDMANNRIHGRLLSVDGVEADYYTPSAAFLASYKPKPVPPAPPSVGPPWTITADSLHLSAARALYAQRGAAPLPGFDPAHIAATDIVIDVAGFRNQGTDITVPLRRAAATERCGLSLEASGTFQMDATRMTAKDFMVATPDSYLKFSASMGMGDISTNPETPVQLQGDAAIAFADVRRAFPAVAPLMAALPSPLTASLHVDVEGSPAVLNVYGLDVAVPGLLQLKGQGMVENVMDPEKIQGQVSLDGELRRRLFDVPLVAALVAPVSVPTMKVHADVDYAPGQTDGSLSVTTLGGNLAAEGSYTAKGDVYEAQLSLDDFPVDAFMPSLGVGRVTADLTANGQGFNPLAPSTQLDASVQVHSLAYGKERLRDLTLDASLEQGDAWAHLVSQNPGADLDVELSGWIKHHVIDYEIDARVKHLDLQALGLSDGLSEGHVALNSSGWVNVNGRDMDVQAQVEHVYWQMPGLTVYTDSVDAAFMSSDTLTRAGLANGDMNIQFSAPMSLQRLMNGMTASAARAERQMKKWSIDIDSLQATFPQMDLVADVGHRNILAEMLREHAQVEYDHLKLNLHNDSLISMSGSVTGLFTPSMTVDSIGFDAIQHGKFLVYKAAMKNQPGTMDDFADVAVNGFLSDERVSAFLRQKNIKGETGFALGASVAIEDSVATLRFVPYTPTIAYKQWTLNPENFVSYDLRDRRVRADLALQNELSYLKLYTVAPQDSAGRFEDVVLQVSQMHIQDWLSISPFAPPVTGDLGADMRFAWNGKELTGRGTLGLDNFCYDRQRVGSFGLDADISRAAGGSSLVADLGLKVDGRKVATAHGVVADSTAENPFLLSLALDGFPLSVANPFLPQGTATLAGELNGDLSVTRHGLKPVLNGFMQFSQAKARATILGTDFKFDDRKIVMDSNVVTFDNFAITGCNANPLTINGTVDLNRINNAAIDLDLSAQNMQILNSNRAAPGADAYGKAFIDLMAGIHGDMRRLDVEAEAAILEGTNMTYLIPDATSALTQRSNVDMVKFVQFADTAEVAEVDTVATNAMMLNVMATLAVRPNTTFTIDLNADGSNRVQVTGAGELDYTMSSLNGDRLTGRYTIQSGFGRYNVPMLGEKRFDLNEGSYVAFNGDMMNPVLSISAVDMLKANVTQEGANSRLITFDIQVDVTGTLQNMNVGFDLSTDDDITIQNQLQSMSEEQRASEAMNLLLTNVYTGQGTSATGNLAGNPLYTFLEGRLNSWIANNVRGVDITFGIDQYKNVYEGTSSTATSYSYQVSKSLFDDRVKIVVGGNYTADAQADEDFSQNLINDISFEYLLNRSGSMYVRIFRHTGYESILEGEVTQTGVGFVLKRSLNSLRDLFRFRFGRTKRKQAQQGQDVVIPYKPDAHPETETKARTHTHHLTPEEDKK